MRNLRIAIMLATVPALMPLLGGAQTPAAPAQTKAATAAKGASATAGSDADARELLAKVIDALGGPAKPQSVHSLRLTTVVNARTEQGDFTIEMEQLAAFPDRSWQKLGTPMGELTVVTTPTAGFVVTPQGTQDLPQDQQQDALRELKTSEIQVAQHAHDPKYSFTLGGAEKVGGVDTQILDVNADGAQVQWYVDPTTGRVLRTSAHVVDMGGAALRLLDFSDWKEFGDIPFPTKAKITRDGHDGGSLEIKDIEINPAVDEKLFVKPTP